MADLLIRDFPNDDLSRLDALAAALGLSRAEYVRRRLTQDARRSIKPVTVDDLQGFASMCGDLSAEGIMREAWS